MKRLSASKASFPPIHLFDESALRALTCRDFTKGSLIDLGIPKQLPQNQSQPKTACFFFLKKPAYYISHIHPYPSSSPISNPNLISHFSLFLIFFMSDSDFYTMSVPSYPVSRSIHLLAFGLFVCLFCYFFCTDGLCRLRCASSCANV